MKKTFQSVVFLLLTLLLTLGLCTAAVAEPAEKQGILTNDEIVIRDPFIITYEDRYYMYGTEGANAFSGNQNRFLAYMGTDLETWEGPYTIYENDGSFWADKQYWAPAMFVKDGTFYFYGAMGGSSHDTKGIFLFKAESPLGPFAPVSNEPITKWEEDAIDAEIYEENGKTYMIYTVGMEGLYCGELNDDLDGFVGETWKLFDVNGCGWALPGFSNSILNDGAAVYRATDGRLICFFSTMGPNGYNMGYAVSDNGSITGNWTCTPRMILSSGSGGHNMIFTNLDGQVMTAYHAPNMPAHPAFKYVKEATDGEIFFTDCPDIEVVTNEDIIIRDPFIITSGNRYYLYGTEGTAPFSGAMDQFLVYTGTDLVHWEGPYIAFRKDEAFWADQRYWAPSIVEIEDQFYLYGTMGGSARTQTGIQTFVADDPLGPFVPAAALPFTSEDYECIDPEVYVEDGKYYMVYSHKNDGDKSGFYAAELNEDYTAFAQDDSAHIFLFNDDPEKVEWAVSSMTDGAALLKTESGRLLCFFSTRDGNGVTYYNMGYAVSDNGRLDGNWTISSQKMLPDGESGGHNMFFTNLDGDVMTTYHSPNVAIPAFGGHPVFKYVSELENGEIAYSDTKLNLNTH